MLWQEVYWTKFSSWWLFTRQITWWTSSRWFYKATISLIFEAMNGYSLSIGLYSM